MEKQHLNKSKTCPVLQKNLDKQLRTWKSLLPNSDKALSEDIDLRGMFADLDFEGVIQDFFSEHVSQLMRDFKIEVNDPVEFASLLNMAAHIYLSQHLQIDLKKQIQEYNRYVLKIEKQATKLESLVSDEIKNLRAILVLFNSYEDEPYFDKDVWQKTLDNLHELKSVRAKILKHPLSKFAQLSKQAPNNLPGLRTWMVLMLNLWTKGLLRSLTKTAPGRNGKTAFLEFCEFCIHVIHPEIEFYSLENALKYMQSKKRELPLEIETGSPSNI